MAGFQAQKRLDYQEPPFTATDTELEFFLSDEYTRVRQVTRYKRLTKDRSVPLRLDGEDMELISVRLNGQEVRPQVDPKGLTLAGVPDDFELSLENVIAPASNTTLMGLYKSNGVFCTQCEPEGFRRITYFLDRPDVQCRYTVTIHSPAYGCPVLLSNGNLIKEGEDRDGYYCVWQDPFPKPSYLFALVAGPFDILTDTYTTGSGRKVSCQVYVDRGAGPRGKYALESIKTAMRFDEERFGLEYDLDNFKLVAVDFFNQGAMENKSLNIFNSKLVLVDAATATDNDFYNVESVVGHEYFHNWTGDRVTLRDWFQLSLKESLTVFRDEEFSATTVSRALSRLKAVEVIKGPQFAEDASPMAHAVRPDEVTEMNNFYTVTIYDKGAEVIRMIHTLLGEKLFVKGMRHYLSVHDGKSATIDDFVKAMEEVSGKSLEKFMRWYTQAGTPTLKAHWEQEGSELTLTLSQSTGPTLKQPATEPFVIPVRLSFMDKSGQKVTPPELAGSGVIILENESAEYVFTGLPPEALPVLLEDFSAPVRLEAPYSEEDYSHILAFASDPYSRYAACEGLIERYLKDNLAKAQQQEPLPEPHALSAAFAAVAEGFEKEEDPLVTAELIRVPPLATLMQMFPVIDLDALHTLREHLETRLAVNLEEHFARLYEKTRLRGAYRYQVKDYACRSAGNLALKMLVIAMCATERKDQADALVRGHFEKANNMTDFLAAMTLAIHHELPCREAVVSEFTVRHGDDPLVYDNYFRIMGQSEGESAVYDVRRLMRDPHFDIGNPNRLRALVGSLVLNNPWAFYRKDGTGMLLAYDVINELNNVNPMMAARMVTPLLSFRRFDPERQALCREYLDKLRARPDLARDVYEKVEAALSERQ